MCDADSADWKTRVKINSQKVDIMVSKQSPDTWRKKGKEKQWEVV